MHRHENYEVIAFLGRVQEADQRHALPFISISVERPFFAARSVISVKTNAVGAVNDEPQLIPKRAAPAPLLAKMRQHQEPICRNTILNDFQGLVRGIGHGRSILTCRRSKSHSVSAFLRMPLSPPE